MEVVLSAAGGSSSGDGVDGSFLWCVAVMTHTHTHTHTHGGQL